jgi:predicted RNase H-like nuclease (RuvC/YqgF family)
MPKIVITEQNISKVVKLLNTWKGKLTWLLLCEKVSKMLEVDNVTRQALSSYKDIQEAYSNKKEQLRDNNEPSKLKNTNTEYLISQINSLEAELAIANKTIETYKQRFVRWQYNAYHHGIRVESLDDAVEILNKPLIEINRRTGGS